MNEDNIVQTLPELKTMTSSNFSRHHWIQFYKNVWTRRSVALAVDVVCDQKRKDANPEDMVEHFNQMVPVKVRLEDRKLQVQDALNVLEALNTLEAIPEAELDQKIYSKEALAVAEDMIPKKEEKKEETATPSSDEAKPAEPESKVEAGSEAKV